MNRFLLTVAVISLFAAPAQLVADVNSENELLKKQIAELEAKIRATKSANATISRSIDTKDKQIERLGGKPQEIDYSKMPKDDVSSGSTSRTVGGRIETTTDLLAKIDVAKHKISGNWTKGSNGLRVAIANDCKIAIPHDITETDYDLELEFTRAQGNEGFGLYLPANGKHILWQISASGNKYLGFNNFIGNDPKNPSGIENPINNGSRYKVNIQVRRTYLKVSLDGRPVMVYRTNFSNVKPNNWGFGDASMGIISWWNDVTIHSLKVTTTKARPATTTGNTTGGSSAADAEKIKDKIKLANLFLRNGLKDKAIGVLRGVTFKYPDHPAAQEAKDLLEKLQPKEPKPDGDGKDELK